MKAALIFIEAKIMEHVCVIIHIVFAVMMQFVHKYLI